MDALINSMTFIIIHPRANLEKVKKSLQILIEDIDLRLKRETGST